MSWEALEIHTPPHTLMCCEINISEVREGGEWRFPFLLYILVFEILFVLTVNIYYFLLLLLKPKKKSHYNKINAYTHASWDSNPQRVCYSGSGLGLWHVYFFKGCQGQEHRTAWSLKCRRVQYSRNLKTLY